MLNALVGTRHAKLRLDVQGLRGFAVLAVVLYHADLGFPAGFLGVDIFFVISGYLISSLIMRDIEAGTFRMAAFYMRRARRLLPAALLTFVATAIVAPLLLSNTDLRDAGGQIVGATTFTANIALWKQSGYFQRASELKPLLHIWSLSIEEQFYMLLPAMLVVLPRRIWLVGATLACAASVALCVALAGRAGATFYWLPTRAWELMVGVLGGVAVHRGYIELPFVRRALQFAIWPALGTLLVLPAMSLRTGHPGITAGAVCVATLLTILRAHPRCQRGAVVLGLSRVGDVSYSLYLVHWPVFAYFHNVWLPEYGVARAWPWQLALVAASFVLAFAMYRFVELPLRHRRDRPRRFVAICAVVSALLVGVGIWFWQGRAPNDATRRAQNFGLSSRCEYTAMFSPLPECRTGDVPTALLWGDSFAMHLAPGLRADDSALQFVQATKSNCGPFLGVAPLKWKTGNTLSWAKGCMAFNDSVMAYLVATPSIQTVIVSSRISQYLDSHSELLVRASNGSLRQLAATPESFVPAANGTIAQLTAMGKQVRFIAAPPISGFDVARCHERRVQALPTVSNSRCDVTRAAYESAERGSLAVLTAIARAAPTLDLVRPSDYLCDTHRCRTEEGRLRLYGDGGHLSVEGSEFLGRVMGWAKRVSAPSSSPGGAAAAQSKSTEQSLGSPRP